ncbi:MAG: GumC family protein [Pseudomonadota bacterium]
MADAEAGFSLARLFALLRKHKWILIGSLVAALAVGIVITLLMTPQYTAAATLEIQRETRNFTNVEGADSSAVAAPIDPEFYQTQVGLLQARSLAERVVAELKLQDDPNFFELYDPNAVEKWFENGRVRPGASTREERIDAASGILLDHLTVSLERLSRLATIRFTSPDPAFSQKVVNAWCSLFIQATLDRRYAATTYARKFLEERLVQLRTRIDQAERDLVTYAANQGIVSLPADTGGPAGSGTGTGERLLVTEDLAALNKELADATAARIAAQSRLRAGGGEVVEALQNQALSQMRARRADLVAQYAEMMERFEPNYPPALAIKSQIGAIDQAIAREEGRIRSTLQQVYQASLQREEALKKSVGGLKTEVFDQRRRSTQYNILRREVDTNRQLYDALLQRYKEIGVAGGVGVNNISVVDEAQLPDHPSSPRLLVNLLLSLIAGALIGAALTFILEQLEDAISDPAEVTQLIGIPLIGVVPRVDDQPVEALLDPKSALSEAYFSVETSLALATDHGFPRTLVVTSSRPGEGKSLTSFGIAKTLASLGRRVVLVDADMRSPSVHHMVNCAGAPGLSNVLAGAISPGAVVQQTSVANLWAIAAGPQPPSSAELLAGNRLATLLATLVESYDHIIVDAPPVMGFADAPLVGSQVEGVSFVIEAHGTGKSVARAAIDRLRSTGAPLFGAIVTKFDVKRAHYGYGYNYGYGYGYGKVEQSPDFLNERG